MTDTKVYNGNENLPRSGLVHNWTKEMVLEYKKCMDDPVYFIETYAKIISVDDGLIPFKLYDFQKETLRAYLTNNNICLNQSRQSGKCHALNTLVRVRNKKTGEIKTITIGELYEQLSAKGKV